MLLRTIAATIVALFVAISGRPAMASQGSCVMPTTGTISGLTFTQNTNTCFDAIQTANSGATAPANTAGSPGIGQVWLDTSTTPINRLKMWDGASWLLIATMDATNHVWDAPIGGGTATVASATTTDLCSVPQSMLTISGTTTIASFSNTCQPGQIKALTFSGALQLTHNATSMILPFGGSNITTAAGDVAWSVYLGGGNWRVLTYQRATGAAISTTSVFTGAVFLNSAISPSALASNTNNWSPSGLSTTAVIRFSCSSPINITGLVAPATDGQTIVLDNIGTVNACTLTNQDSNSSAGNRFLMPAPLPIYPLQSVMLKYDLTATAWRVATRSQSQAPGGVFSKLAVTNNTAGTPNNQMVITADSISVKTAGGLVFSLSGVSVTPDITASGANGLDTGTVAQGNGYYIFVIYNPTAGTVAGMFSLQSSCASVTMPASYTGCARVGWNYVENAAGKRLNRITCAARRCGYVVTASSATPNYPILGNATAGSITAPTWVPIATAGVFVPATASQISISGLISSTSSLSSGMIASPNNSAGGISSPTNPPVLAISQTANGAGGTATFSLESSSIYWASVISAAGTGALVCTGWEDNL